MNAPAYIDQRYRDATDCSSKALERMAQLKILPTPENYTLWFHFESGSNPRLCDRLKQLLQDQTSFTNELNSQLYKEFFEQDQPAINLSSNDAVVNIAGQIRSEAEHIGNNITDYGNLLNLSANQLQNNPGITAVQQLATQLIRDTQKVREEHEASTQALKTMSGEIERLTQELREASEIANTDALTGIANRRRFENYYRDEFTLAEAGQPLTCLLIDIDHFKKVNDTYGHPVGDLVIRFTANLLRRAVGDEGMVARYGGEEFVVLLPKQGQLFGENLAESIRKAISKQELKSAEHKVSIGQITISVGVSTYKDGDSMEGLIERTDSYLYKAKEAGRNRVVSDSNAAPPAWNFT
ncbi:MAG: GGDEF domain-containing protein [Candidatus Pelagadaptatus aseana]|uniref:GGDEF domain-containing protein n=1 Tax=Candidatus Pelagadaptatus aseana TaxID=3120508 RepID=UPI0039B2761E